MAGRGRLETVIRTGRANALLAWLLIVFLGAVALGSLAGGDPLWAGFAAAVAALALAPTVARRDPAVTLPWEVLAIAALPLLGRALATVPLTGRFATYLAVAAAALIVAVELDAFTPVRMTPGFAILFVVVATMATAGVWAVVRWGLDATLRTEFLLADGVPEAVVERRLMWEFVYSTAAGIVAGVIFEGYFRRRARLDERLPDDAGVVDP